MCISTVHPVRIVQSVFCSNHYFTLEMGFIMNTKLVSGLPRPDVGPPLAATRTQLPVDPELTDDEIKILVYVGRNPNCSRHEIACDLNMSPRVVDETIRSLVDKEKIERKE